MRPEVLEGGRAPGWASPFRWLSPAGRGARLQIFIFHRVLAQPDPLLPHDPDAASFETQCRWIRHWFRVLPLAQAVQRLQAGTLDAASACITFDDGYRDNLEVAAPILRRHGLPATFFISTGFTAGGRMWNDSVIEAFRALPAGEWDGQAYGLPRYRLDDAASRVAAYSDALVKLKHLPLDERLARSEALAQAAGVPAQAPMMTVQELRQLQALGMEIGAHTRRHPILATLPDAEAEAEMAGSRDELTAWLGQAPSLFAYPNGRPGLDYSLRDRALAQKLGFAAAVSTAAGASRHGDDLFQLRRFTPWDSGRLRFGARLMQMQLNPTAVL